MDIGRTVMMGALALALLSIVGRRQLLRRPALFLFLLASFVMALRAIGVPSNSPAYITLYCQSELVVGICECIMAIEIYRITIHRYPGLGWIGRAFGAVALSMSLIVAAGTIEPGLQISWRMGIVQAAFLWRLAVSVGVASFCAMMMVGTRALKNTFSGNYLRYRKSLVVFGLFTAVGYSLSLWRVVHYSIVNNGLLVLSVGFSLVVLSMGGDGECIPVHRPRMSSTEAENARSAWDEAFDALRRRWRKRQRAALESI